MTFIPNNDVFMSGMPMPSAVDIEANMLGYMMTFPSALAKGLEELKGEMFYDERHELIFKALGSLYSKKATVDNVSVAQQLIHQKALDDAGGAAYIADLYTRVHLADDLDWHISIIKEKYVARRVIEISHEMQKQAYKESENAEDLLNVFSLEFIKLSQALFRRQSTDMSSIAGENEALVEHMMTNPSDMIGIRGGIDKLDRLTLGFQSPDFIVIAGRPGMGKTALALSFVHNIAQKGVPVAFFSLEMNAPQVGFRLASMLCGNSYNKIRGGMLSEQEYLKFKRASEVLKGMKIYIDDQAGLNIFQLRAKIHRLKNLYDIKAVFVDYIQLMRGIRKSGMKREEEIASISGEFKAIAKDMDIPVIGLSQLSRATEIRGGQKRPQLSDLRESGAIEQDADVVMFVYRPEYYGSMETKEGVSLDGYAEIIVEKHRNGKTGIVPCFFDKDLMYFRDDKGIELQDYTETMKESKSLFADDETPF